VAVQRGLKLGEKRPNQKTRKVRWTRISTELPQKVQKKFKKNNTTVKMATT